MKRQDLVKKIQTTKNKLDEVVEQRKSLRETLNAYETMLEMSDNGQLDIFDDKPAGNGGKPSART